MREVIETADFVREATDWIARRIVNGQSDGGVFRLSLCGGSTPKPIYQALSQRSDIDWSRVLITFGDERCVPPDHADSNYRMAKELLLDPVGIPEAHVIRMEGELDPADAAALCEGQLRGHAAEAGEEIFRHDLILLGMGGDGHTASLFPETAALAESDLWVSENYVPKLDSWRMTLTYPLINAGRCAVFLINDPAKRPVIDEIFAGEGNHPAGNVSAEEMIWILG